MMDELELLKKDWQKRDKDIPQLSYDDIYNMTWKKSSSIVKWILIISILEFTLPHLLYLIPAFQDSMSIYDTLGFKKYFYIISVIQYTVIIYFIYQFYKRYKEISVLENAKTLMQKIIKTRKTVKNYVVFSLSMILFTVLLMIIGIYISEDFVQNISEFNNTKSDLPPEKLKIALMVGIGIFGTLLTLFMGAIYFLLYGRLLKKLKKNYYKLKKLEV
ncbi:hypothetical protein CLV91_3323 [Maribacter vaceletii]|uniref:Uncharacterized protein n=1 Tax=Maribacter vaceletii TaxID=1206816 RepID=A0A495DT89_9FLAO|nr:hypothetical protein [Maribacter vaceletii]RKR06468.1 hypothetical protein CLV91_3323 [Maribacter vaceletii]